MVWDLRKISTRFVVHTAMPVPKKSASSVHIAHAKLSKDRQVSLRVLECHIWRIKAYNPFCIRFDKLPNTTAQDGTDQDVRVENNHLNASCSSLFDAVV